MLVSAPDGPWFRQHPRLAAAVTLVAFLATTLLRVLLDDGGDAAGLLYALPVALAAMAFGREVGTAASVAAGGLLWMWALGHADAPGAVSLGSRVGAIVLLGPLVGAAADAAEAASRARTELAVADARRRDAAEVHDEILQRLAVAKWRLEAGDDGQAADLLEEAIMQAQGLVSTLLAGDGLEDRLRVRAR